MFKVPEKARRTKGQLGSNSSYGNNGFFQFKIGSVGVAVIASDGEGWEHVSVSLSEERDPTWEEMCKVKDVFWDEGDCVIQYHPPKESYINHHPHCLHLWRVINKVMPIPPTILVGIKKK